MSKIIYDKVTGEISMILQSNDKSKEDVTAWLNTPPSQLVIDSAQPASILQDMIVDVASKSVKLRVKAHK